MFSKILMRLARAILESVMQQMTSQINQLLNLSDMISGALVSNLRSSWEGDDCDALIDDINGRLMGQFDSLLGAVNPLPTSLLRAAELIEEADNKAQSLADDLAGAFSAIF